MGEQEVPDIALYGAHTARSLDHFRISGRPFPLPVIKSMALLKMACARANQKLGQLDPKKAEAIVKAAKEIHGHSHDEHFPIDVFQAGSGTSSHTNLNEVIANLANESLGGERGSRKPVHPNDDVNMGQSSNNVVASGIRMASYEATGGLLENLNSLIKELNKKASEFKDVLKSARTHLQDAVPITLGQEFSAYARALEKDTTRIGGSRERLLELGIGGNAVGTGVNTKHDFRKTVIGELVTITKTPYRVATDGVELTMFLTDLAQMSSTIKLLALDLQKISNDLRLLSSGPNTGFGELILPPVEPGSSIMPGKVNPSIPEAVIMACMEVQGNDHAVSIAAGAGQLELNTHKPLIAINLLESISLMTKSVKTLGERCIKGIKADEERCRENVESSAGLATILNPKLGYDKVSSLVKESLASKKALKQLVLEKKLLTAKEFDELMASSTRPNL